MSSGSGICEKHGKIKYGNECAASSGQPCDFFFVREYHKDVNSDQGQVPQANLYSNKDKFISHIELERTTFNRFFENFGIHVTDEIDDDLNRIHTSSFNSKHSIFDSCINQSIRRYMNNTTAFLSSRTKSLFASQQSWIFLLCLSVSLSFLGFMLEHSMNYIGLVRLWLVSLTNVSVLKFLIWVFYSLLCCSLGALIVHFIAPYAAGSGIPSVKSILSGVSVKRYLSFRTLMGKCFGLIFVHASGMFIGKEGPYVHISVALANQLGKLRIFKRLSNNKSLKLQLFAAGCAAGVAFTFNAPVGGVIFSIEVTSTYYMIENLTRSFFCTILVLLTVNTIASKSNNSLYMLVTDFPNNVNYFSLAEIANSIFLGIVCGLLGIFFIYLVKKIIHLIRVYCSSKKNIYLLLLVVSTTSVTISYFVLPIYEGYHKLLGDLFNQNSLGDLAAWSQFSSVHVALLMLFLTYFLTCSVSISLPVVCGLYTPVFISGALIGRLFGEVVTSLFGVQLENYSARCALFGAAAFAASVTRTLSSSIICMELTRQISFLLPMLLSVMVSYAIANYFMSSLYDELLEIKKLPHVPSLKIREDDTALQLVTTDEPLYCLSTDSTFSDLKDLFHRTHYSSFPLVKSLDSKILLGTVHRKQLKTLAYEFYTNLSMQQSQHVPRKELAHKLYHQAMQSKIGLGIDSPLLNFTVFQFPASTSANRVHYMFNMLRLKSAYVLNQGELLGVITRKKLINASHYNRR